jgi:hypothetical protein
MNGIHVIDLSKAGNIEEAIEKAINALLGEDIERPLRDPSQEKMRKLLLEQGTELNDKVELLKRLLNLTADLIDLINEDHIKEDGLSFIENRAKQAAVTKKMIAVMESMRKAEPNGAAGR